ncbi:cytochrome b/b6 domain-containing protein [Desulfatitalea alkaliphila]|uniref:Cytochrome b/b6 domain-containing protein n=1 Tax=Desulfatitalea alkaliphila TaxID=2929485 RepID=A0AA41R4S1_9BACT|nr:cytochrome b/b6 domain-containing protein [Desulfatitalea alkaliphila]MCJ8501621.1 cytochrome b/b6 domain-containing protein [Desulfatitalea alkaliphila]
MKSNATQKVYLFTRFERFWHWLQAALILGLMGTGLEIHGTFALLGYARAVRLHNFLGLTWVVLFCFILFWAFTTGEWRQYIPTTRKLLAMARYYALGMFKGEAKPVRTSPGAKHNPLQRLAYLGIVTLLLPVQMVSGLLYYTYNQWTAGGLAAFLDLGIVALVHTAFFFLLLAFLVSHLYLATLGHTLFSMVKTMVTGWAEIPATQEVHDWEWADRHGQG